MRFMGILHIQENRCDGVYIMTTNKKIIFDQAYYGFEAIYDISRDMDNMWDERMNPLVKGLPSEFEGTIRITVTYEGNELI